MKNYLKRIGINTDLDVNLNSLKLIQKQHLLTVPFENLDMHIYKELRTDFSSLYCKIVEQRRGGVCYELNWLLYFLLKNLGFNSRVLGGKASEVNGSYFDHILLAVELNEREYLVDVGFGDNFLEPLEFQVDVIQKDNKGLFKIVKLDEVHFELQKYSSVDNDFKTEYIFINEERKIEDFQARMDYFILSDESIFKKNLFCSLEREDGRISLKHDKLLITQKDVKTTVVIKSPAEYINCLEEKFAIVLESYEQNKIERL